MRLSLIIPCYNEGRSIPALMERCSEIVRNLEIEVIFVDNGSTDDTPELLEELLPRVPGCRSVRVDENIGYGWGILKGLEAAKGTLLGWTHADLQTDPLDALKGLELFERHGPDIFVKGLRHGRPPSDTIFTAGMSVFETILLGRVMRDINAQPTMFSRDFFRSWSDPPRDFSLDLYAYYTARTSRLPVHRFPVQFTPRIYGISHWNFNARAKIKFIKRALRYSVELKRRTTRETHRAPS